MVERFISEPITPTGEAFDLLRMSVGEPGLPQNFIWRNRTIEITAVLKSWRESGRCRHGSNEMYVRKHWYEVTTSDCGTIKIYFDRQPRSGRGKARWWLFSIKAH